MGAVGLRGQFTCHVLPLNLEPKPQHQQRTLCYDNHPMCLEGKHPSQTVRPAADHTRQCTRRHAALTVSEPGSRHRHTRMQALDAVPPTQPRRRTAARHLACASPMRRSCRCVVGLGIHPLGPELVVAYSRYARNTSVVYYSPNSALRHLFDVATLERIPTIYITACDVCKTLDRTWLSLPSYDLRQPWSRGSPPYIAVK